MNLQEIGIVLASSKGHVITVYIIMKLKSESQVAQLYLTLCDPMEYSLPCSSVHGIFQARIQEWVAISFSRRSSSPRDWTCTPCVSCLSAGKPLSIHTWLWPPDVMSGLIGKDPDAGKDWGQEKKGTTEDEIVGWHHWLDGHVFEQAPGDSEGQGSLAHCSA